METLFIKIKHPLLSCLWLISGFSLLSLVSCASLEREPSPSSEIVRQSIYKEPRYVPMEGSLWPGETSENLLFADTKAKQVGDVVTINLEEDFTSTNTASTDTSKDSDINVETGSVFGLPSNLGINDFLGSGASFNPNLEASTSRSTQGSGTTRREGSMSGTMAAMIVEVLPNGTFRIEGRRSVSVNNEEQIMVLKGVIRRVDIGFDNSISSTQIANASIQYTGKGVIADEQNVGWLTRFLAWVWPF